MIEVRIQYDPTTGKVQIAGPMDQPLVMLGLLDMGREIVHQQTRQPVSPIVRPSPLIPLRNGR